MASRPARPDTGLSAPLLQPDQRVVELQEAAKPPPKPAPAKKEPWAFMTSFHFIVFKRSTLLLLGLAGATWAAAAITCHKVTWFDGMSCSPSGTRCLSNVDCSNKVWDRSSCFNGFCVDESPDMHVLCTGKCTYIMMETIIDVIAANLFLVIYWAVGEYLIRAFDLELRAELAEGRAWQKHLDERDGVDRAAARADVAHSWQWCEELVGWQERKKAQKGRFTTNVSRRAYAFYFMFFVIIFLVLYLITGVVSPKHVQYPSYPPWTIPYLGWQLESFKYTNFASVYFWIILVQFILEAGLFFAAAFTVRWPQPALVRSSGLAVMPRVNRIKDAVQATQLEVDEHPGLVKDTCLLVACHESCLTKERRYTFSNTIRDAMRIFPPSAIFVCDNGNSLNPVDRTEEVCEKLSREFDKDGIENINYLYIPEGNKSHAMYWTTEYWIPELVRRKECKDFAYALMIDDDVPLPPDLHVPLHTLSRQTDIKAVSYVICAATESGNENHLVNLQDAEYKLAGFVKQFQWNFGSTMACHGAIGLWRRDVLGKKILWDHDTVFHGEDLYMGLLLHRMKKNYTIMVAAGAVVPTFAPENMLILFRQRVTSWDLCAQRKFLTYLRELLGNWFNTRTYVLKPFLLQEVINILLDWSRIYLMVGLGHRNVTVLLLCFAVFYTLLYIEIIVFNFVVLRDRPDLRMNMRTVFLFPFYRTWCLIFRLYALLRNIIMYATWTRKYIKISVREQDMHDIPPVPPNAEPDWWTIWHPNTKAGRDEQLVGLLKRLCAPVDIEDPREKQRFKLLAEAALLYNKLLRENALVDFPRVLALATGSAHEGDVVGMALEGLRLKMLDKLESLISSQSRRFENRFYNVLNQWCSLQGAYLFFNPTMQGAGESHLLDILRSNVRILQSINQVVASTRWPASHDPVSGIKKVLFNITEHLAEKIVQLESEEEQGLHVYREEVDIRATLNQATAILNSNDRSRYDDARRFIATARIAAQRNPTAQGATDVLTRCTMLEERLRGMQGPITAVVEAGALNGSRGAVGAGAGVGGVPAGHSGAGVGAHPGARPYGNTVRYQQPSQPGYGEHRYGDGGAPGRPRYQPQHPQAQRPSRHARAPAQQQAVPPGAPGQQYGRGGGGGAAPHTPSAAGVGMG